MSPYKVAVWIVAIVLYWLMPFDVITDLAFPIGFLDDVLFTVFGIYKMFQPPGTSLVKR